MTAPVKYHSGKFPPEELDWARLVPLIGPASASLARYDALLLAIPNASVLLSPLTTQEAVLSSRIEGTQATMGEVLQYEAASNRDAYSAEKREALPPNLWVRIEGLSVFPIKLSVVRPQSARRPGCGIFKALAPASNGFLQWR